jgi:hypothetical protein
VKRFDHFHVASDVVIFGAALCLICAPALLCGKFEDFSDDAFEPRVARAAEHGGKPRAALNRAQQDVRADGQGTERSRARPAGAR